MSRLTSSRTTSLGADHEHPLDHLSHCLFIRKSTAHASAPAHTRVFLFGFSRGDTSGQFKLHEDLKKYIYDKGKGYGAKWDETGEILYIRGLIMAMLGVEAIRIAHEKFGKKPMTGEQVRWGLEKLNLSAERLKQLGFENELQPIKVSCADHEGTRVGRVQTWDGKKWNIASDWITADDSIIAPMVKEAAAKYAAEKKVTPITCSDS
jgi:branched-chain amino acid transport system substrate-binding protein